MAEFSSGSEAETLQWAQEFATSLKPGDRISLTGDLGCGKTVISRGIAQALGYKGDITSPSYTLVNQYLSDPVIYHIDLYRLGPDSDFNEIGIDHYLSEEGTIALVEWPDRLTENQIGFTKNIRLTRISENERLIEID